MSDVSPFHQRILDIHIALAAKYRDRVRRRADGIELLSESEELRYLLLTAPLAEPVPEGMNAIRVVPWAGVTDEELRAHGFKLKSGVRFLSRPRALALPEHGSSADPEFVRVRDASGVSDFAHIHTRAYLPPGPEFDKACAVLRDLHLRHLDDPAQHIYLGLMDGKPVATGVMALVEGAAVFYSLAVLPEYAGQGLGRTFSLHLLTSAQKMDCDPLTIQVISGLPVERFYYELGFEQQFEARVYVRA